MKMTQFSDLYVSLGQKLFKGFPIRQEQEILEEEELTIYVLNWFEEKCKCALHFLKFPDVNS